MDNREGAAIDIGFLVIVACVWLAVALYAVLRETSLAAAVGYSIYSVALLIGSFASIYVSYGSDMTGRAGSPASMLSLLRWGSS